MIIVTGGAGFVGSNLVRALNERGVVDVIVVDDLSDGTKFRNLLDCQIADYWDKDAFLDQLRRGDGLERDPVAIFHQGACTDTMQWNGRYVMANNFEYSKVVLEYCLARNIQCIYASSAAVYGTSLEFRESGECERPCNVYGYSKLLFDQYVRAKPESVETQIVGLRYFNVYGPNESHKGKMASVAYQFHRQLLEHGRIRLFEGTDNYGDGEQRRDFIHVSDVVAVNLWFLDHTDRAGIFNVGTGCSSTFNEVATAVIGWHGRGDVEYVPFPAELRNRYQSYTEADPTRLREAGYAGEFVAVQDGVPQYLATLEDAAG